jgi:hypothetical protein
MLSEKKWKWNFYRKRTSACQEAQKIAVQHNNKSTYKSMLFVAFR